MAEESGRSLYESPVSSFVQALALCHSVQIQVDAKGKRNLQASSPDELALVRFASRLGYDLHSRQLGKLVLKSSQGDLSFKILCEMPFDSTRKCMSIILRDASGQGYLYTKGADNMMLPKINF